MMIRLVGGLALAAVLVLLWVMPIVLFSHPGINEALELSLVGPLLYVVTLGAGGLSLVGVALLSWKAEDRLGSESSFSDWYLPSC